MDKNARFVEVPKGLLLGDALHKTLLFAGKCQVECFSVWGA